MEINLPIQKQVEGGLLLPPPTRCANNSYNKSRSILAFLDLLVEMNVFVSLTLSRTTFLLDVLLKDFAVAVMFANCRLIRLPCLDDLPVACAFRKSASAKSKVW